MASPILGGRSTAKQVVDAFGSDQYLKGKTAIVTGGNSGIGLETCKALSSAGAKVILSSRSVEAGQKAIEKEIKKKGKGGYIVENPDIIVKQLDLSSLKSIKSFTDEIKDTESIDFLILNAGIMAIPKHEFTEAGFEKQIGVNHFGHFYLTQLLMDKMKGSNDLDKRIVVLSSTAHAMDDVDPDDLHYKKKRDYKPWTAYGQSKAANLLFAKSLGDKLEGSSVSAVSVHPGVIRTNLWRATLVNRVISNLVPAFGKSIPQGAATTVWACLSPRVKDPSLKGSYLSDCAPARPQTKSTVDADGKMREKLWKATEEQLEEALNKLNLKGGKKEETKKVEVKKVNKDPVKPTKKEINKGNKM